MKENDNNSESEINEGTELVSLVRQFWDAKVLIFKLTLIFVIVSLIYAVLTKNYYTSSSTIVPITESEGVSGNISGLASLAGINLGGIGSSSGEIPPELYPEITSSIPFKLELLDTKIKLKELDSLVTYRYYFEEIYKPGVLFVLKKYTIGLPGLILKNFREKKNSEFKEKYIFSISNEDFELIEDLKERINLNVNEKEGFVTISFTMPEALPSAQMTLRAQELLQEYALKFKTQKSREQLEYIEDRFKEKEREFEEKKLALALFQDQNNNINSAVARTKLLQLQAEYDLAFTVYSELAKQLETQRLQVKKDTPIFTILKPVTIPNKKAGPARSLILIGFTFFGFIVSLAYIYIKSLLPDLKKEWEEA